MACEKLSNVLTQPTIDTREQLYVQHKNLLQRIRSFVCIPNGSFYIGLPAAYAVCWHFDPDPVSDICIKVAGTSFGRQFCEFILLETILRWNAYLMEDEISERACECNEMSHFALEYTLRTLIVPLFCPNRSVRYR